MKPCEPNRPALSTLADVLSVITMQASGVFPTLMVLAVAERSEAREAQRRES